MSGGVKGIKYRQTKSESNRDKWMELLIDSGCRRREEQFPNRGGKFYASVVGNPRDRFLYLHYHGMLPPLEIDAHLARIFDVGNSAQDRFKKYFINEGVFVGDELSVSCDEPPISGRVDLLLNTEENGMYIIEMKTINSRGFIALDKPKIDHEAQLQVYLNLLDVWNGGFCMKIKTLKMLKFLR